MKKIIIKLAKKLFQSKEVINYKIGERFYSNSLVDTLVPEFIEIGDNFISAPGSIILAHDSSPFLFTEKYRITMFSQFYKKYVNLIRYSFLKSKYIYFIIS